VREENFGISGPLRKMPISEAANGQEFFVCLGLSCKIGIVATTITYKVLSEEPRILNRTAAAVPM
jgi:hypothetical protein